MKVIQLIKYPIKSLEGVPDTQAYLSSQGGFVMDREFRFMRVENLLPVNGKREPRLSQIRFDYHFKEGWGPEMSGMDLKLLIPNAEPIVLNADGDKLHIFGGEAEKIERALGEFLGYSVVLEGTPGKSYFPDDTEATGPTVVSDATLRAVSQEFQLEYDEVVRRFRPNIILSTPGGLPFWEEQLTGRVLQFGTGSMNVSSARLVVTNICKRCAVPTRDSRTGVVTRQFLQHLREWRNRVGAADGYLLTLNTKLEEGEDRIQSVRVGEEVLAE